MVLLTDQLRMDRSHKMAEQILNLTLEIIYLLTGEDYTIVKKSGECGITSSDHQASGGWSEIRSAIMVPPSPMHERNNEQKIVEITNKILQVLTGEVPVRCQDVTVYFSMEEWEYMEGHKDQYKDVLMEDPQPLATIVKEENDHKHKDGPRNSPSPESYLRPVYSKASPGENPYVPLDQQNNDLIIVKVEEMEGDEEYYTSDDIKKEEETLTNVSAADVPPSLGCCPLLSSSDYSANLNMSQTIYGQPFITINLPSLITGSNLLSVPTTVLQPSVDQSQAPQLPPKARGEKKLNKRRTEGRFPCAECGKSFAMRSNFLEHLKVHTVEKPLSCTVCGKCFKRKSDLVRHQKTHTGEKPHLCTECGKRFAIKSNLFAHHRIHTGERPFPCPVCGKCFIQKSDLVVHQIAHTGEKPFGCRVCGKYFNRKRSLVRHERIHMRDKS